jgi:hypothetical protein
MAVGFPAKTNFATGDVLTATNMNDVTGTLNLLQQDLFPAGRNKIINADFGIWQRGTSSTTLDGYLADRWRNYWDGTGTFTITQQSFTAGTAPVTGYEGTYFQRIALNTAGSSTYFQTFQRVENVRTFAGQTFTLSFWAKANASKSLNYYVEQQFGSGGSATITATSGTQSLTTSWQRFSITATMPSVSGKTIGTSSYIQLTFRDTSVSAGSYFDIWGVQFENGSTASPFQIASGSIGGELALCQRYYYRNTPGAVSKLLGNAHATSTTSATAIGQFPVTMRTAPTALEQNGTANNYAVLFGVTTTVCSAVPTVNTQTTDSLYAVTLTVASGLTLGQAGRALTDATNGATAYLGWSAEL